MTGEIIKFFGGAALFLGAAAWLIRSLVSHRLSKDIENFKTELQHQSKLEIQQVAVLHTKRAEVIAELYRLLVEFVGSAESYASLVEWKGEPSKDEKAEQLGEIATEFRKYFVVNRIYFTKNTCSAVDELWLESLGPIRKYSFWRVREDRSETDAVKAMEAWETATDTMTIKVPVLLATIEDEFRGLLGVEEL